MVMSSRQLDKNLEVRREIWANDTDLGRNSIKKKKRKKRIWSLAIVIKVGSLRIQKVIVVSLE